MLRPVFRASFDRVGEKLPAVYATSLWTATVLISHQNVLIFFVLRDARTAQTPCQDAFFPNSESYHDYEMALKSTATRTRLTAPKISQHCARHGGASTAAFMLLLDLQGIQKRERGPGANSVRSFEKAGTLTGEVAVLNPSAVNTAVPAS